MEFPSLHELCIHSIAAHVGNGMELEDVLNDDEKHELLNRIRLDNGDQTRVIVRELFKKCKFRRVSIDSKLLQVIIANFKIDNLVRLTLKSINQETLQEIQMQLMATYGIPILVFDILHLIDLIIEPGSRESLKFLDISMCNVGSGRNIFEEVAKFFPSVTTLALNQTNLTNHDFNAVCQFFTNLTNLSVANNAFDNLKGISNLQSLEVLNISQCYMENDLKMREIFTLNNLRVLDISSRRDKISQNLTHYLSCNQALPQLEFIDVSFNEVTEEQLGKLVQTHPTLVTVSLIGTPLQTRAQFENHTVELVTVQDLEFCMRSMRRYSDTAPQKGVIMHQLWIILSENYESQERSVLKQCLHELLDKEQYDHFTVECILCLCRYGRMDTFSFVELQKVLRLFFNVCPSQWNSADENDAVFCTQFAIWRCLEESKTIKKQKRYAELLCQRAAEVMKRCPRWIIMSQALWEYCLEVLRSIIDYNPDAYHYMSADLHLTNQILFHSALLISRKVASIEVCKLANMIIMNSAAIILPGLLTTYLCRLLESSIQFQSNELQQTAIQNGIQTLLNSRRLRLILFFKEPLLPILTNLLKLRGFRGQKLTVMLFCWLKHYVEECAVENLTPANFSQMEEKATPIINAIYWYRPTGDNGLDIYQYLVCHGREEVAEWAQWVLNGIPGRVRRVVEVQPAVEVQPVVVVQPVEVEPAVEDQAAIEEN